MPTAPRRPQAHRHRQQFHARRLRAAELFAAGIHAAEIARQLGVSRQAASRWHVAWKAGGTNALASRGRPAPPRACRMPSSSRLSRPCARARSPTGSSASCGSWTGSRWSSSG